MDARRPPRDENRSEAAAFFLEAWLTATIVTYVLTGCASFGAGILLLGLEPTDRAVQVDTCITDVLTWPSSVFLDPRTGFHVFALNATILGAVVAFAWRSHVSRRS